MTDPLLTVGESLSPLAAWKRRHHLLTVMEDPLVVGEEGCAAFYVMKDDGVYQTQALDRIGRGDTEEAAALDYCTRNNLKSWVTPL